MALEEAAAWLDGDLVLPIAGKKYRVPEYSAEVGMRVEVILHAGNSGKVSDRSRRILDDEAEKDLYRDVLGSAYDELVADVSWSMLKHCAVTAMFHFNISPEVAEERWNQGVSGGKAPAGKTSSRPATRRTTGAASSTKSRASGSGTRSRRSS